MNFIKVGTSIIQQDGSYRFCDMEMKLLEEVLVQLMDPQHMVKTVVSEKISICPQRKWFIWRFKKSNPRLGNIRRGLVTFLYLVGLPFRIFLTLHSNLALDIKVS